MAALVMILMSARYSTAADLYWEWSFTDGAGLQQGYFVTDGGPFTTANPASGTYNVLNFIVTSSPNMPLGSMAGGTYNEGVQSPTGFVWDNGTAKATEFFREGGTYTNGANYYQVGGDTDIDKFLFYADGSGMIAQAKDNAFVPITLQAVATPVPEPSTYALSAVGVTVIGFVARRQRKSKSA